VAIKETKNPANEGWLWEPLATGGVLRVNHSGAAVSVILNTASRAKVLTKRHKNIP
jgi:hypothetical protein